MALIKTVTARSLPLRKALRAISVSVEGQSTCVMTRIKRDGVSRWFRPSDSMGIVDADAEDQTRVWTVIGDVRDDIQSDSKLRTRAMDEPSDF